MSAPATKRLAATAAANAHMRSWFATLQERLASGAPYALVDADAPQEIFRAMGIDYVVTQWWSSLISAKQLGDDALSALGARGYPDDIDQYNSIPLGASLLDRAQQPWGGLPAPALVVETRTSDARAPLGAAWRAEHGCEVVEFERAAAPVIGSRWWERIDREWESIVGTDRLDLMVDEIELLVERCEHLTRRPLDMSNLRRVLDLVNEQVAWNRRTRDLLATSRPAPVDIADSIPAVMIPQWHRGTEWARDAARNLSGEVAVRVDSGAAVCPDERIRMMWIGRGLWFDPGFVQRFHARGAVFVWSMYHSLAADAYARFGDDPFRTIAARFAPFPDVLGAPGWVDEWYVNEVSRYGIDGVVHLAAPDSRSAHITTTALEAACVPVFEIDANNADRRSWDGSAMEVAIGAFIDARVEPRAAERRAAESP
jgi:hypothetical protein